MNQNPFSLEGRTALVAGASRGIGLAIAEDMAAAGARTILASRSLEKLTEHAGRLTSAGYRAEALQLDISDPDSFGAVVEALPEIDILVNVAGTNIRKPFLEYTRQDYEYLLRTNLNGIFELTQKVGAGMTARRKGKVIHIGSLMSLLGLPYLTIYGITKSALAGFTRTLAAEWAQYNIQVNCIAPGFILTDLNWDMWQREDMRQWRLGAQPNPELGTPADVAPLAVFLASRGGDYITGQVIAVDGGYSTTAKWPFEP